MRCLESVRLYVWDSAVAYIRAALDRFQNIYATQITCECVCVRVCVCSGVLACDLALNGMPVCAHAQTRDTRDPR